jgi:hypothetical protein
MIKCDKDKIKNVKIKNDKNTNCIHKGLCNINKYGQCNYDFVLYCKLCKYGLRNIYDKCKNKDCSQYLENMISPKKYTLEEDVIYQNPKHFCYCIYGIEGYYNQCKMNNCPRYKTMEKELKPEPESLEFL